MATRSAPQRRTSPLRLSAQIPPLTQLECAFSQARVFCHERPAATHSPSPSYGWWIKRGVPSRAPQVNPAKLPPSPRWRSRVPVLFAARSACAGWASAAPRLRLPLAAPAPWAESTHRSRPAWPGHLGGRRRGQLGSAASQAPFPGSGQSRLVPRTCPLLTLKSRPCPDPDRHGPAARAPRTVFVPFGPFF